MLGKHLGHKIRVIASFVVEEMLKTGKNVVVDVFWTGVSGRWVGILIRFL